MNPLNKSVTIELRTTIDDNGQMEYNTIKQQGNFYKRNELDVLTYEEKVDGQGAIKNLITIQPDRVSIKRSGNVTMNQKFRSNHTTENVFQHPHGNIHMETFTNSIRYKIADHNVEGELNIFYTVKLNGQEERKHELVLTYKEDPQ
ncbi:hypothetical protein CIL03_12585 [Virgibacillus indicus]|uniref:DUF1934 domain-containing protein n=1 Tax=Virgibacillus indicus TaxID=2024554 RepID=A0A265NB09_9BACI|nr:DUF1934 domain-containing protein [Virgibacillus indicus]OZU88476.1 hypothetical protein CIL03_12585 [Virgibacillus indicus]